MSPFVFRVESVEELCEFLMKISCGFRIKSFRCWQDEAFTDLEAELHVDCTLSELMRLALQVDDGHLIVETLKRESTRMGRVG